MRSLLGAGTPVVSIFGKSWELHTKRALGITEEENLKLISETVRFLKEHGKEVVYDAEHFFDGYQANPAFALRTLEAAQKAGADVLVLCDTNGGTLTGRLVEIVAEVRKRFDGVIGIHTHNDSDVAVANALAAVEQGCTHVQGCMNGYGERCGNANLCSDHRQPGIEAGAHHHRSGEADQSRRRGALHRRAGQPAAARRSAVRGPQRVRAQGRRARERGAERFRHLRARAAGGCRATASACW